MRWGWVVVLGMFVLSVDEPQWIRVFSGLSPRQFDRLVSIVADRGGVRIADGRACRPWSLRLADRVLLVAVYLRTNLTHRQIAPLFGVDKSAVNRINASLKPLLALETTPTADTAGKVFIVDGTLDTRPRRDRGRLVEELPPQRQPASHDRCRHPPGHRRSRTAQRLQARLTRLHRVRNRGRRRYRRGHGRRRLPR